MFEDVSKCIVVHSDYNFHWPV